jgi:hypothetical protein
VAGMLSMNNGFTSQGDFSERHIRTALAAPTKPSTVHTRYDGMGEDFPLADHPDHTAPPSNWYSCLPSHLD